MTIAHMTKWAGLAAILALVACDGGNEPPRQVKKISVGDSEAHAAKLRALSDQNRDLALRRAVQDGGQRCRRVESSREVGRHEDMSMWTASCDGGDDWAIFIAPTGDIQVRSCGHVAQLGLPTCETGKPRAPGAASESG